MSTSARTERRVFFACGGVARGWRQVVALDHCLVNGTENNKGDRWYNHLLPSMPVARSRRLSVLADHFRDLHGSPSTWGQPCTSQATTTVSAEQRLQYDTEGCVERPLVSYAFDS